MTIDELIRTRAYMGNQTLLAKKMKVQRNTLRLYLTDIEGTYHDVKFVDGEPTLFTNVTKKIGSNK